ncbi:MAG: outer membrane biosynthesis protein TonB [Verrucomicrobiales bacterium]
MYALQAVAPHSSLDWLLAIDPGETKLVTIKHGASTIGSESFTFSCPQPEPEPEPVEPVEPVEPQPDPVEPIEPQPETAPQSEPVEPTEASAPVQPAEPTQPNDETELPPVQDVGETTPSGTGDDADVDTEVLGETVEDPGSNTEAIESGDIDEIIRGAAGSVPGSGQSKGGGISSFMMAMMAMWILVAVAGGLVAILTTRRNAQTA